MNNGLPVRPQKAWAPPLQRKSISVDLARDFFYMSSAHYGRLLCCAAEPQPTRWQKKLAGENNVWANRNKLSRLNIQPRHYERFYLASLVCPKGIVTLRAANAAWAQSEGNAAPAHHSNAAARSKLPAPTDHECAGNSAFSQRHTQRL